MIDSFRRWGRLFLNDNLFRNSVYLMLSTVLMGGLGFFFWIICTHIFSPDQIGIGTSLISAMGLISTISLLGFNATFVRVLPTSENRDNEINTGSLLVIIASVVIAIIYILLIPFIAPSLTIIHKSFWYAAGFVVMVALASINSLTDSIFIAYRAAQYALITDGIITSGIKLLLPLFFIGLGAYGVFASAGLGASIGMIASILYLIFKFGYRPKIKIDVPTLKNVFHYSFTNYIANLLGMAPTLILPIIVLDHLGAAAAGYYYLAFMVINLLYTVSISISQSLFAEGSYSDSPLRNLFKRSAIILFAIMIPASIILMFLGPFVLGFFGKSYSEGGSAIIVLLALSAPVVAIGNIGTALLKITKQVYALIFVTFTSAVLDIGLSWIWIERGLVWVAIAWIIGSAASAAAAFFFVMVNHQRHLRIQRSAIGESQRL
jgi:O-antigen/teichoic acid export membrane protein